MSCKLREGRGRRKGGREGERVSRAHAILPFPSVERTVGSVKFAVFGDACISSAQFSPNRSGKKGYLFFFFLVLHLHRSAREPELKEKAELTAWGFAHAQFGRDYRISVSRFALVRPRWFRPGTAFGRLAHLAWTDTCVCCVVFYDTPQTKVSFAVPHYAQPFQRRFIQGSRHIGCIQFRVSQAASQNQNLDRGTSPMCASVSPGRCCCPLHTKKATEALNNLREIARIPRSPQPRVLV